MAVYLEEFIDCMTSKTHAGTHPVSYRKPAA